MLKLLAVLPNGEDLLIWHAPNAWDPKHYHRDRIGKTNGIPHGNKQSHLDRSSIRLEVANEMPLYIVGQPSPCFHRYTDLLFECFPSY